MHQPSRLMVAAAALALASTSAALAQTSPPAPVVPVASPMPAQTPDPGTMSTSPPAAPSMTTAPAATAAPAQTAAPAPASTGAPSTDRGSGSQRSTGGNPPGQVKKLKTTSLTRAQVVYGLTHQVQAAKQLLKMKTVNFDNLRVYKLPTTLQSVLKVSDADSQAVALALLGSGVQLAQTTPAMPSTNGNNSPIQYLRDVLANINVSNALNNLNVLNNSNVNVNVALSNVLNNNKISIGQVVGLYIGGGGIITTITK